MKPDANLISFIGSGNLAWHLAPALDNVGIVIREVYSRNPKHAEALTERLYQAEVKATLDFSTSDSRIFIIAVTDDAIQDIVQEIILPEDAILVHTSGTQPLSVLQFAATTRLGVIYPLQTFTKSRKVDFKKVPMLVEASDEETEKLLTRMVQEISSKVQPISSVERKALHVAAVFASNFTNHMLTVSRDIMQENNLNYALLLPLITETIEKSLSLGPQHAQTGPAKRGDLNVLDEQHEFLSQHPEIAEIYKLVSQNIIDRYAEG